MRGTSDPLAFYTFLENEPYRFDFFYTLRRLEALHPKLPRLGTALKPADEPVRFGQEPDLSFAPATISKYEPGNSKPARMEVRFFGMFGPNGALPTHLTEYARGRLLNDRDPTFVRFVDIFHHRFIALFYRAWAQAQPTASLDRPKDDRFTAYVGSSFGLSTPHVRGADAVPDAAKLYFA
ncbi:MAG TPA: type VI secretion system baseplate subunit TssG, partial [Pseudomonadales bacterium]|nr:type VI secretion system baseplate subunit TssG [Pseudomonadales bacterium]